MSTIKIKYDPDKIAKILPDAKKQMRKEIFEEVKARQDKNLAFQKWTKSFKALLSTAWEIEVDEKSYEEVFNFVVGESHKVQDDLAPINYLTEFKEEGDVFVQSIRGARMIYLCQFKAHKMEEYEVASLCKDLVDVYLLTMYRTYMIVFNNNNENTEFLNKLNLIVDVYENIVEKEILK
jgi:hypothetical protein